MPAHAGTKRSLTIFLQPPAERAFTWPSATRVAGEIPIARGSTRGVNGGLSLRAAARFEREDPDLIKLTLERSARLSLRSRLASTSFCAAAALLSTLACSSES